MNIFYIFLDIDGVLNNEEYWYECYERHKVKGIMSMDCFPFDPKCLNNLMILNQELHKKEYEVKIILSSTWRLGRESTAIVNSRLAEYGMRIASKTRNLNGDRGQEIKEFLNDYNHPRAKNFLIIDDEVRSISKEFEEKHIIETSYKKGFDEVKLKEAILKVREGDKC